MDEKLREKFVEALDKAIKTAGAKDYLSGMEQARKLIGFVYEVMESMKAPDDLRAALDSCPPLSKREEVVYLLLAQNLPALLRIGLKKAAKKAADELPALNSGRPPALSRKEAKGALDYVSKLHPSGCPLEVAKFRAARQFDCSERTIDRLWKDRASYEDNPGETVSMADAIAYFTESIPKA